VLVYMVAIDHWSALNPQPTFFCLDMSTGAKVHSSNSTASAFIACLVMVGFLGVVRVVLEPLRHTGGTQAVQRMVRCFNPSPVQHAPYGSPFVSVLPRLVPHLLLFVRIV
jgi:hypothetical protein